MSKAKRIVLLLGCLALLANILYAPWEHTIQAPTQRTSIGTLIIYRGTLRQFLLAPPESAERRFSHYNVGLTLDTGQTLILPSVTYWTYRIDWGMLAATSLAIAVADAALFAAVTFAKKKQPLPK